MLKRTLVAAAIAGFATVLAGQAAMAAASKRTGPVGSVRFTVDSPSSQRPVSRGVSMSAGQKKPWILVPAVQIVREKAAR
jgi:hypothetical protein